MSGRSHGEHAAAPILWPVPLLIAIATGASLLRFLPWYSTPLWGSDTGEYFALTSELVRDGRVRPELYDGWGEAYPYFLGLQHAAAALSLMTGLPVLASLAILPAIIGFPASFVVYLIATRVCRSPSMGLLSAGIVAVAMPHAFATSHPMPGALGDLFLVAALYAFLRMRESRGFAVALALLVPALIITHHLSTYIFVVAAAGGLVVREMLASSHDRRRARMESWVLAAALGLAAAYWWVYAEGFRRGVLQKSLPTLAPLLLALSFVLLILLPQILPRLPRFRYRPKVPDMRNLTIRALLYGAVIALLVLYSAFVGVPATTIRIPLEAALLFVPLLALFFFAILGSKVVDFLPDGNNFYGWAGGIALSSMIGAATGAVVLSPYRHVQYFMLPVALLAGAGLMHFLALLETKEGRKKALAGAVAGFAVLSAWGAYPPPDKFAGFDESLDERDFSMAQWSRASLAGCEELPRCTGTKDRPAVASDHRLSSALYSFGVLYATWDTTPRLFHNDSFDAGVRAELAGPQAPHAARRVDYVAYDRTMESGVALDPNAQASRPSEAAIAKFEGCPFTRIYDNGYARVYLIDWGRACP
jgi:hypothetical protein